MNIRRKHRILQAGKSPSVMALIRTYNRATLNGGVTQDFSANIENIREISRKLGYNIVNSNPPPTRNLLQWSEEFDNAYWTKTNSTITANAVLAPNNTLTADLALETNVNSNHYVGTSNIPFAVGTQLTLSAYIKFHSRQWVIINAYNTIDFYAYFDVVNGVVGNIVGSGVTASISDAGNGWWRCSVTRVLTNVSFSASINFTTANGGGFSYSGDITKGYYIWGAQLELGSVTTPYQITSNSPIDGTNANFLYVPSSYGEGKNFAQVQNKRNLLQWSEDFTQATWVKTATSITANTNLNPFGINKSYYILDGTSNAEHYTYQQIPIVSGTTYTTTLYVKKADFDWIRFASGSAFPTNTWVNFNLNTGLFGNVGNSSVIYSSETLTNGYFKVKITATAITTVTASHIFVYSINNSNSSFNGLTYLGASNRIIDIAAQQLEQGVYVTPYQKTVAAGDGIVDFNFTRATSSTVTNKQGVIEDSCYNLLQRSEEFDSAYWSKLNTSISANATSSPNNTLTSDKIVEAATGGSHPIYIPSGSAGTNLPIGTVINFSIYAKYSGTRQFMLFGITDGTDKYTWFDLINGTFSNTNVSLTVSSIIDKNGFYRCNFAYTITNASNNIFISPSPTSGVNAYVGDGVSGIYIWGAQLTQGSTPRPYLRTTNRLNVPRLDYSRSLLEPSLLIEPASTNLLLNSATGTTQNVTVTAVPYTLSLYGTGTYTLSGAFVGALVGTGTDNRVTLTFTPIAGTLTLTASGSLTKVQLE